MSWLGHVFIAKSIANDVTNWIPQERRPIEKSKQRWIDKSKKELEQLGLGNIYKAALNRCKKKRQMKKSLFCSHGLKCPLKMEEEKEEKEEYEIMILLRFVIYLPTYNFNFNFILSTF